MSTLWSPDRFKWERTEPTQKLKNGVATEDAYSSYIRVTILHPIKPYRTVHS